ncbi:MAG: Asp-tRNA(Asn)/Glu-tRNA(Gln) amidotransferase subunit GatC [Alphaproteobacteria bacterium]
MTIDNKTVKKVAKLAKIRITLADEEKLIYELNNILKWVDELKEVNTDNVEPMLSVFNESMFLREDKPSDSFSNKLILKNSPKDREGFFVVPKVVE